MGKARWMENLQETRYFFQIWGSKSTFSNKFLFKKGTADILRDMSTPIHTRQREMENPLWDGNLERNQNLRWYKIPER